MIYQKTEDHLPSEKNRKNTKKALINHYMFMILNQLDKKRDDIHEEFRFRLRSLTNVYKEEIMRKHWIILNKKENQNGDLMEAYHGQGGVLLEMLNDVYHKVKMTTISIELKEMKQKKHEKVSHHLLGKSFKCQHCGLKYSSIELLQAHLTSLNIRSVLCTECGEQFNSGKMFKKHFNMRHHFQVECAVCFDTFEYELDAYIHFELMHTSRFPHNMCDLCGLKQTGLKELLLHLTTEHKKELMLEVEKKGNKGPPVKYNHIRNEMVKRV